MSPEVMLNQMLWYNSLIRIAGKPIFYKKCFEKGVHYVKDIVDSNNEFLSYEAFVAKYGQCIPFTKYFGVMQ